MIYNIFIYDSTSGKTLLHNKFKNYKEEIKENSIYEEEDRITIFSGILSTINLIIQNILFEKKEKVKLIQIGDYNISFHQFFITLPFDLVIIYDDNDPNMINELLPEIRKILYEFENIFREWDGDDLGCFSLIEESLTQLIRNWINFNYMGNKISV